VEKNVTASFILNKITKSEENETNLQIEFTLTTNLPKFSRVSKKFLCNHGSLLSETTCTVELRNKEYSKFHFRRK
jgi:hypothetical protein